MVDLPSVRASAAARQARILPVFCLGLLVALLAVPAMAAPRTVAVFDFQLIDTSLEGAMMGKNDDQEKRLGLLAPIIRKDFDDLAGYETVETGPVEARVDAENLMSCGGCATSFAKELGADLAFVGTVQKVSNLILNVNGYVYDVSSGKEVARGSTSIRSNTDESWTRGANYLWKETLKKQLAKTANP